MSLSGPNSISGTRKKIVVLRSMSMVHPVELTQVAMRALVGDGNKGVVLLI